MAYKTQSQKNRRDVVIVAVALIAVAIGADQYSERPDKYARAEEGERGAMQRMLQVDFPAGTTVTQLEAALAKQGFGPTFKDRGKFYSMRIVRWMIIGERRTVVSWAADDDGIVKDLAGTVGGGFNLP